MKEKCPICSGDVWKDLNGFLHCHYCPNWYNPDEGETITTDNTGDTK